MSDGSEYLGHRLIPATFWLDGGMVDGLQCGLCHRNFLDLEDVADSFGECDVFLV